MGRNSSIDLDLVQSSIKILNDQNKSVNAASIRQVLGGGSPNHIQKFLVELKNKNPENFENCGFDIPNHVLKKFSQIYTDLRNSAGFELKNLQTKHQIEISEKEEELILYKNYSIELELKIQNLESQLFDQKVDEKVELILKNNESQNLNKLFQVKK